jgi:uncharacterized protein DUF3854
MSRKPVIAEPARNIVVDTPPPPAGNLVQLADARLLKKLNPEHLADLRKSGLSDHMIEYVGEFKTLDMQTARHYLQGWHGRMMQPDGFESCYLLPYPRTDYYRVKLFPPLRSPDGHTVKYIGPKDAPLRLYFGPKAWVERVDGSGTLYITEGEKKTLALEDAGFAAIGIGGVWAWLHQHRPLSDFDLVTFSNRPVVLVFDSDTWRRQDLKQPIYALGQNLRARGAIVEALELPTLLRQEKTGVDDYLVARHLGRAERRIILQGPGGPSATPARRCEESRSALPVRFRERGDYLVGATGMVQGVEETEGP